MDLAESGATWRLPRRTTTRVCTAPSARDCTWAAITADREGARDEQDLPPPQPNIHSTWPIVVPQSHPAQREGVGPREHTKYSTNATCGSTVWSPLYPHHMSPIPPKRATMTVPAYPRPRGSVCWLPILYHFPCGQNRYKRGVGGTYAGKDTNSTSI